MSAPDRIRAQISTLDPWNMIYYMVTGKNVAGKLVNAGQQITREEAIRLYSVENGWFLRRKISWARLKRQARGCRGIERRLL